MWVRVFALVLGLGLVGLTFAYLAWKRQPSGFVFATDPPAIDTIAGLLENQDKYNVRKVRTSGVIRDIVRFTVNPHPDPQLHDDPEDPHVTYRLCDGDRCVNVWSKWCLGLQNGQRWTVTGTFFKPRDAAEHPLISDWSALTSGICGG